MCELTKVVVLNYSGKMRKLAKQLQINLRHLSEMKK